MKLHIDVDSSTGLVHSAVMTAANMHNKHPLPELLNATRPVNRARADQHLRVLKAIDGSGALAVA